MISRITNRGSWQKNVTYRIEDIIKKIISENIHVDEDYFIVFCQINHTFWIVKNVLEVAYSICASNNGTYKDLKPLIDKLPDTDHEIKLAKIKSIFAKMKLFQSIIQLYESTNIKVTPVLSELIQKVVIHEFDSDDIQHVIYLEIMGILKAVERSYRRSKDREYGI
ncbi:hypothetical protein RF11_14593 [Thelohanellus kitauei]|uniref:Uncharacterized protein n=1 Tax=Thelohanellus kitauei TaxID=669202 RepID=A0A0C2JNB6_THEKT|nr:hypothetical protein RF11_14593 [Thelohanellus kitauei]